MTSISGALPAATGIASSPNPQSFEARLRDQQRHIADGLAQGRLTPSEAAKLTSRLGQIQALATDFTTTGSSDATATGDPAASKRHQNAPATPAGAAKTTAADPVPVGAADAASGGTPTGSPRGTRLPYAFDGQGKVLFTAAQGGRLNTAA
jgi:hypothetical protein